MLRTFGSDLEKVLAAVGAFAQGRHPEHTDFKDPNLDVAASGGGWDETKVRLYRGRYVEAEAQETSYNLYRWTTETDDHEKSAADLNGEPIARGDEDILSIVEDTATKIVGIQDDYLHWAKKCYRPTAGKPVWVVDDQSIQKDAPFHIMFDDNIHNDPHDSIVAVRYKDAQSPMFRSLKGEEIIQMQGKHLVRVPTIEPIFDRQWFVDKIKQCQMQKGRKFGFDS